MLKRSQKRLRLDVAPLRPAVRPPKHRKRLPRHPPPGSRLASGLAVDLRSAPGFRLPGACTAETWGEPSKAWRQRRLSRPLTWQQAERSLRLEVPGSKVSGCVRPVFVGSGWTLCPTNPKPTGLSFQTIDVKTARQD